MRVTVVMIVVVVAMVLVGGGACGASDGGDGDGVCGDGWWAAAMAPPSDAWVGAVTACRRAPACPQHGACDDPRWRVLADWVLDEIARCFAGPCEERAECVAAAMPPEVCWTLDGS